MKHVAVVSSSDQWRGLFDALEMIFPIRFQTGEIDTDQEWDGVVFTDADTGFHPVSPIGARYTYVADRSDSTATACSWLVQFSRSHELDPRLRGRTMRHQAADGMRPLVLERGAEVVALAGGHVVWAIEHDNQRTIYRVAAEVPVLHGEMSLYEFLKPNRFFALLPLIHFLRELTRDEKWNVPPIRATHLIDDPNLHWPTYGYLNYRELASHAERNGYHVAIATIPLDSWYVHPLAARAFRMHPEQLSLLIHGNNHMRAELARDMSDDAICGLLKQSLTRIGRFEERAGLPVARVVAPPHDVCSAAYVRLMRRFPYDAVTTSDLFRWTQTTPVLGVNLAEIVEGVPILKRICLKHAYEKGLSRDDIVLSAYLDKPIILYGHHQDLAGGLDILAELADFINGLGNVEWSDLNRIIRANYGWRMIGSALHIKPWARRIVLDLPDAAREIVIHKGGIPNPADEILIDGNGPGAPVKPYFENDEIVSYQTDSKRRLDIRFQQPCYCDPCGVYQPRAMVRRVLTEARDRLFPICCRYGLPWNWFYSE